MALLPGSKNHKGPVAKYNPIVSYVDPDHTFLEKVIAYDSKDFLDTVRILSKKPVILRHTYNMDDHYFIFSPGDTLHFTDETGVPGYTSNHISYYNALDYVPLNTDHKNTSNNFSVFYMRDVVLNGKKESQILLDSFLKERQQQFRSTTLFLDSLKNTGQITKKVYALAKSKTKFDSIQILFNSKYSYARGANFLATLQPLLKQDSLLAFKFYRSFLQEFVTLHFKIKTLRQGSSTFPNAKQAFDSVLKSDLFTTISKDFLLHDYLNKIAEYNSLDDLENYFNTFKLSTSDTLLVKTLENNYLLNYQKISNPGTPYFINRNKRVVTMDSLLQQYKGQVVYIDFWASWCAPCRRVMPDSEKLRQQFADKPVTFLYISIDSNYSKWERAGREENLFDYKHNLLAMNYPEAVFFKNLNLKSIPRYLLYDKNGQLVHANAPGPESENIIEILENLITPEVNSVSFK